MISKICSKLGTIQIDKVLHFIVAYIIFDLSFIIISKINYNFTINTIISFIITSILIFYKEYYDKKHNGKFDWKDIFAGYLGVLFKIIILLILIL